MAAMVQIEMGTNEEINSIWLEIELRRFCEASRQKSKGYDIIPLGSST